MIHRLRQIAILIVGYGILAAFLVAIWSWADRQIDPLTVTRLQHGIASYQHAVLSRPVVVLTMSFWTIFFAAYAGWLLVEWRKDHPRRPRAGYRVLSVTVAALPSQGTKGTEIEPTRQ